MLRALGMRIDVIYPADDPQAAILSHEAGRVRLTLPGGAPEIPAALPPFDPQFLITRAGAVPAQGRAGMLYRDLIPGRLGGRYVASHITITRGGPVDDWVHYHRLAFQMIHVRRGWVRLVYEDQGEPFVMEAGDTVLQPPTIRHQVLESSPGLEVVEISSPALHETFADHEMRLPNGPPQPARDFRGQRFLHQIAALTPWSHWNGAEAQESDMAQATNGLAEARILRGTFEAPPHDGELVFGFVLAGSGVLGHGQRHDLAASDCFVIPPGDAWAIAEASGDFRLLHVTTARLG